MKKLIIVSVFSLVLLAGSVVPAHAQTVAELQALLLQLQAQLNILIAQQSGASASVFTRNLTIGSTGADVTALQNFLIGRGYNTLPTGYFGPLTQGAVASFQASRGISPAVGYFGPITRAAVVSLITVVPPPTTGGGTTTSPPLSGGEGSLDNFRILSTPSNENISEGEKVRVLGFEFKASDSDLRLDRVDVNIDVQSGSGDPFRAIRSAALYMGNTRVAEISGLDVSNNWTEESNNTFRLRFTPTNAIVRMNQTEQFYVEFQGLSSIDESRFSNSTDFNVYIPADGLRVVDARNITTTAPSSDSASKNIDVSSPQAARVTITEANTNPQASTVVVNNTNQTSNVPVLVFDVDTRDQGIDLHEIRIQAESASSSVNDIVGDLVLDIGGKSFSGTINSTTATSTYYTFDINGDVSISANSSQQGTLRATFNRQQGNYLESGESVRFALVADPTNFNAESQATNDTLSSTDIGGGAEGNDLSLALQGIGVTVGDKSTVVTSVTGGNGDYVTNRYVFRITALEDTLYVPLTASATGTSAGFNFTQTSSGGGSTFTAVDQLSNLTETNGSVRINRGQTAEIEVALTFNPTTDTYYSDQLDSIRFSRTSGNTDLSFTAPNTSTFKSELRFVSGI